MADYSGTLLDSVLLLTCPSVGFSGARLQGFGTDDMISGGEITDVDVANTVDGIVIASGVASLGKASITLSSASPSVSIFDAIRNYRKTNKAPAKIESLVWEIPAIGKKITIKNAYLTNYKGMPDGKNKLGNQTFEVTYSSEDFAEATL